MTTDSSTNIPSAIRDRRFTDALAERYLAYALSTITARSLPDSRDGLKPVHRRLLWAMRDLKLYASDPPKKSARVVGDVIGKFHPHGDTSVYDALVRLAQDFNQRYPLIDGQGNFGNIDGDNAAAMRYTEARLTRVAELLLEGLDEDAVDFRSTYDGNGREPVVLPAAFPNLLANGSMGIAVGMATSIPPHNVAELCEAMRHLIKHPNASFSTLADLIPGPDFPTGGLLMEDAQTIASAWETGHGAFRLRARWHKEDLRIGQWQIVVTEIPWQVPKARLIEKLADLIAERKTTLLEDVRDESTTDVRLVLVPRSRTVDADALMESLFRMSELEVRISLNLNVLDNQGVPRVMTMREALRSWLDHRHDVLVRRATWNLNCLEDRLVIVEGYRIAFLNLDAIIHIIRTEDDPSLVLQKRFSLTDRQAEAILNMRLRALRKLDEIALHQEAADLAKQRDEMQALLADEERRWQKIDAELVGLKKMFASTTPLGRRRTEIVGAPKMHEIPKHADISRDPVTLVCSRKGWVRALRGHALDMQSLKWKEGDAFALAFETTTADSMMVAASDGRFYTLEVSKIPSGRGFGEPLRVMIDVAAQATLCAVMPFHHEGEWLVASSEGRGFRVKAADVYAQTRGGKQVMKLDAPERLVAVLPCTGDHVGILGSNRKFLVIPSETIPIMARGRGVILQRYKGANLDGIVSVMLADGLIWPQGERTRTERDLTPWIGSRGSVGRTAPRGLVLPVGYCEENMGL